MTSLEKIDKKETNKLLIKEFEERKKNVKIWQTLEIKYEKANKNKEEKIKKKKMMKKKRKKMMILIKE